MIDPMRDDCGFIRRDREPTKRAVWVAVAAEAEKAWEKKPATRQHPSRRGERSTSIPVSRSLTAWK